MSLTEWKVDAPASLKAGQVAVKISNGGQVEHELLVFKSDLEPARYPLDSDGNIKEDGAGITKVSDGDNIAAGGSQLRTLDLTKPGRYLFICNIPSHFKQGMVQVVTVTQ
ncbi:MAG TPA: plastocyanin/azurin family copper-binding protein [Candidatus Dormibacteraeota bacterium]